MATISIQVQCPDLLWVSLPFELVCDDPRNTVLMVLCHFLITEKTNRGSNQRVGKYGGDGLGYRDDEVRVSYVWDERGGEN